MKAALKQLPCIYVEPEAVISESCAILDSHLFDEFDLSIHELIQKWLRIFKNMLSWIEMGEPTPLTGKPLPGQHADNDKK